MWHCNPACSMIFSNNAFIGHVYDDIGAQLSAYAKSDYLHQAAQAFIPLTVREGEGVGHNGDGGGELQDPILSIGPS